MEREGESVTKEKMADMALSVLDAAILNSIGEIDSPEKFRNRVLEVHRWSSGEAKPPAEPDIQAICFYGLVFLGAAKGFPETCDRDFQVSFKRLFFRQVISECRFHDRNIPSDVCTAIDKWMERCELDPRYEWQKDGKEVLLSWSPGRGTIFTPLSAVIEQAARLFLSYPEEGSAYEDFQEWVKDARFSIDFMTMQHASPYYGNLIRRITGCLVSLAERAGYDTARRQVEIAGKKIGAAVPVVIPEDVEAAIKEIEIETGLRLKDAPSTSGWRERRRARRKRERRR